MSVDFTKPSVKRYFGKNLQLAQQNYNREIERAKSEFRSKYPNANPSHFEFWNWPNCDGTITEPTEIVYTSGKDTKLYNETGTMWKYSWPVNSPTFQNKYRSNLFFGPSEIWQTQGKQQPFALGQSALPFHLNTFKIYISNVKGFNANFDVLDTKWKNEAGDSSILHAGILKYDEDPYLTALVACYVITVKSGMCMEHFKNDNKVPKITTSIFRYYLYCNMARFLHDPSKLKKYITTGELSLIQKHIPIKKIWKQKYKQTKEIVSLFLAKKRKEVRNVTYYGMGIGGVIGIKYEEVTRVTNLSDDDWIRYIPQKSNGLTSYGLLFLQNAVESYVYAVLGAQARKKWPIMRQGAKSLQTQHTFGKIVNDNIAQDNEDVLVSDMRKAIESTNVILNLSILPGVILVPSIMIILDRPIAGYNNVLTTATEKMKFGVNQKLNFSHHQQTKVGQPLFQPRKKK